MTLLLLAWTFLRIGMVAFGGGYAMIPLMQAELEQHGWIDAKHFADIVAISQMTPGPIAVNAATYIGFRTAGLPGAIAATAGVCFPCLILSILAAHGLAALRRSRVLGTLLAVVRPAAIGLIAAAVVFFAELSVLRYPLPRLKPGTGPMEPLPFDLVHPGGVVIFGVALLAAWRMRLHPVAIIAGAALAGLVLM